LARYPEKEGTEVNLELDEEEYEALQKTAELAGVFLKSYAAQWPSPIVDDWYNKVYVAQQVLKIWDEEE